MCNNLGNLREDILKCKEAAEAGPSDESAAAEGCLAGDAASSRSLGQHYLTRYFLLIAFRCYLLANPPQVPSDRF
jgi:hypothetical protein